LVGSAKLQFEADLLETRRGLEESKAKLEDLKTEHPLDVKAIIETEIEVEAYQDGINRLNKLGQELGFING
jgi:predicted nuclease with TOPRIM domain